MLIRLYLPALLSGGGNAHFGGDFGVGRDTATHHPASISGRKWTVIPPERVKSCILASLRTQAKTVRRFWAKRNRLTCRR